MFAWRCGALLLASHLLFCALHRKLLLRGFDEGGVVMCYTFYRYTIQQGGILFMLVTVDREGLHIESDGVTCVMKDDGSISVKRGGVEIVDAEIRKREISELKERCEAAKKFLRSLTVSKIDEAFSRVSEVF